MYFLACWLRGRLAFYWCARLRRALAAVFGEVGEQRVHGFEARRINHRAAVTADSDQSRAAQAVEVKCQGVGRELERGGDLARGHTLRSGLHQQAEHVETTVLGERGQSRDGICLFHTSTNIEIFANRQALFQMSDGAAKRVALRRPLVTTKRRMKALDASSAAYHPSEAHRAKYYQRRTT